MAEIDFIKCLYCSNQIDKENMTLCDRCDTPHHTECFIENKGCTVFGCKEGAPQKGMTDNLEGFLTRVDMRRKEYSSLNPRDATQLVLNELGIKDTEVRKVYEKMYSQLDGETKNWKFINFNYALGGAFVGTGGILVFFALMGPNLIPTISPLAVLLGPSLGGLIGHYLGYKKQNSPKTISRLNETITHIFLEAKRKLQQLAGVETKELPSTKELTVVKKELPVKNYDLEENVLEDELKKYPTQLIPIKVQLGDYVIETSSVKEEINSNFEYSIYGHIGLSKREMPEFTLSTYENLYYPYGISVAWTNKMKEKKIIINQQKLEEMLEEALMPYITRAVYFCIQNKYKSYYLEHLQALAKKYNLFK